ncbi:hypothetical protein [Roseibium litorale]|uniref:Uncharacterized protein n=1 Tax=Roseibium litorale TaxID=2803841 RepID=A0ABR9CTJ8_9HYPH|nr:hypothetical protein [Roseibium litorale]MBD8894028.1 hypothetical protein [Roseibium litorale]
MRLSLEILSSIFVLLLCMNQSFAIDLQISPSNGSDIKSDSQYYVKTSCKWHVKNLEDYASKLNSYGDYDVSSSNALRRIGEFVRPHGASIVFQYIGFSDRPSVTINSSNLTVEDAKSLAADQVHLIFEYAKDRGNQKVPHTSGCDLSFFLFGKSDQAIYTGLAVSTENTSSRSLPAMLAFFDKIVESASVILWNKPISSTLQSHVEQGNNIIDAYNQYRETLKEKILVPQSVKLREGTTKIETHAVTVTVNVRRVDSYLKDYKDIPFSSNADRFLSENDLPSLSKSSRLVDQSEINSFLNSCVQFREKLEQSGIKSELDIAYLMTVALKRSSPDLLNVRRCLGRARLFEAQREVNVARLIRRKLGDIYVIPKDVADEFMKQYAAEINLDGLEELKKEQAVNFAYKKEKDKINGFFNVYGNFVGSKSNEIDWEYYTKRLRDNFSDTLIFYDVGSLMDGFSIKDSPEVVIQEISKRGYNLHNCYVQNTGNYSDGDELGDGYFQNGHFIYLMHKVDPPTIETKDLKKLKPETAIVVRGYFDKSTNKIAILETVPRSALPIFKLRNTCNDLWDPVSKKDFVVSR